MEEIRCSECGEVLEAGAKECPKCGCPINKFNSEEASTKSVKNNKRIIMPIVSMVIGIVIIILGAVMITHKSDVEGYEAKTYDVDGLAFGADFYTEIYGASDTIVDELNDINGGIAAISESFSPAMEAIYYGCGMVIVALGLGTVAISLINFNKLKA